MATLGIDGKRTLRFSTTRHHIFNVRWLAPVDSGYCRPNCPLTPAGFFVVLAELHIRPSVDHTAALLLAKVRITWPGPRPALVAGPHRRLRAVTGRAGHSAAL